MRPSITHKRQRDTRDRHYAEIHSDVNNKMRHKIYCQSDSVKYFKIRRSEEGNAQDSPNDKPKQSKQNYNSNKSPLFRESGENKIGLILR